jgi:hypothetical protein
VVMESKTRQEAPELLGYPGVEGKFGVSGVGGTGSAMPR